jgi:shikimate dehydrogenase
MHSISPAIYAAAFRELGVDAEYRVRRIPAGQERQMAVAMRELAVGGGGNVTVPHKPAAARALESPSDWVQRSGACNCFWLDEAGGLAGDNTDVGGFAAAVASLPGVTLGRARVLLLGAGGGARAVLTACSLSGVQRVDILNRSRERALSLAAEVDPAGGWIRVVTADGIGSDTYELAVNATSLGLSSADRMPLQPAHVSAGAFVDLVYAYGGTQWSRRAASLGLPSIDGLTMLVHQAALSIGCWFPGTDVEFILPTMRRAAAEALRERGRVG